MGGKTDPNYAAQKKNKKKKNKRDIENKVQRRGNVATVVSMRSSAEANREAIRKRARRRSLYGYAGILGGKGVSEEATIRTNRLLG